MLKAILNKNIIKKFVYTLILIIGVFTVKSQHIENLLINNNTQDIIIKNWSVDNGISSNAIIKIAKTHNGQLFIITYNGISLFNGKVFENYTTQNLPVLKTNYILDFCVTNDSLFWIATGKGIVLFNGYDFYRPKGLNYLQNTAIQCVNADKKGNIWIATLSNGLFKYKNNKLHKVTDIKDFDKDMTSMLFTDNNNNTWIGTSNGKLYMYNGKQYKKMFEDKQKHTILSAVQDKSGDCFFGTRNSLFIYNNNKFTYATDNIKSVNDIFIDKFNNIWLATSNGLYYYNKSKNTFNFIRVEEELNNYVFQTIYFDKDNNSLWIGSYRKGLLQLRPSIFRNMNFSKFKINETPSALAEKNDTTVWVGTDAGNIYENSCYTCKPTNFNNRKHKRQVKKILVDSKQNIWVCTYNGLFVKKNNDKKCENIQTNFINKSIRDIIENNDGNYWVATDHFGIYLINKNFEILKHFNANTGLASDFVMSLTKGNNNTVFVATKNGVNVIENKKITKHYSTKNGLVSNLVFNIYQDKDSCLWFATIGGLSLVKNNKITTFNNNTGLIDERIFDVVEDDLGFMWLPIINGILRVKKSELLNFANGKIKSVFSAVFNKSDGMDNDQYVSASKVLKLKNGGIVFNNQTGISLLNPFAIDSIVSKPIMFIENISTESAVYTNNKNINIPPHNKYFQINYEYIDFINSEKTEIQYMLEPFDTQWQKTKPKTIITYTNLPPGDYIFHLKAVIKSKKDKELLKILKFTIKAPFYEYIWFKVIIFAVLLFAIWFGYKMRTQQINIRNIMLQKEVNIRTKQIQEQNEILEIQKNELEKINNAKDKMFSIIGHDLKNPIGTINTFMDLIIDDYGIKNDKNKFILNSMKQTLDETYSLLDNLLIWSRNQRGLINCKKENFDIKTAIEQNINLLKNIAKNKNIIIKANIDENYIVNADKNMIGTVLRNIITNSIKFTEAGGEIKIVAKEKLTNNKSEVEIKITDNGIGISNEYIEKLNNENNVKSTFGTNNEKGSGLGLSICIDFLNKHNKKLIIKNNKDYNNTKGSTFSFCVNRV